jgi:hypothetical protein
MLPAMRLSCGAPAARLPWGVCVASVWLCLSAVAFAQTAPAKKSSSSDVLNAPPPAPELTEQDERKPPDAGALDTKATKEKPTKPQPEAAPSKPPAKPAAPKPAAPAPKPAAPAPPPPAADPPAEVEAEPEPTPPPPSLDGDFAGAGAPGAAAESPANAGTQDDFAVEAQEYSKKKKREYSVRIDLLNWLLLGRLSIELEAGLWKFLSVQLTPVFVLAQSPIAINYAGLDDPLTQHSRGIGPLSGISLGVAAWLWGEPFKGYVLRLEITNYAYSYRTKDAAGQIDRVDFTERRAILFIGSHSRFGAFTFAGGFGLGYELNQQTRCGLSISGDDVHGRENDCHGRQQIALDRGIEERADLNGPLHPVYFQARFSIGVVF